MPRAVPIRRTLAASRRDAVGAGKTKVAHPIRGEKRSQNESPASSGAEVSGWNSPHPRRRDLPTSFPRVGVDVILEAAAAAAERRRAEQGNVVEIDAE
jgi:hypothetical protein